MRASHRGQSSAPGSRLRPWLAVALAGLLIGGPLGTSAAQAAQVTALAPQTAALPAAVLPATTPTDSASMRVAPATGAVAAGGTWTGNATVQTQRVPSKIDVMFVLDATGSMGDPISWVRDGMAQTIAQLQDSGAEDMNFGIAVYGDHQDYRTSLSQWYVEKAPLGSYTTAKLKSVLQAVTTSMGSGSDIPESATASSMQAASTTAWRPGATRYVVNITDASWKEEPKYSIDGQSGTYAGLKALMASTEVNLSMQAVNCPGNCSYTGGLPAATVAPQVGAQTAVGNNAAQLNRNIVLNIEGASTSWDITHATTCVYLSDGAPSTDLVVDVTPASKTVESGSSAVFPETATAVANPQRYNETTECTIQFKLNGDAAPAYEQKVTTRTDDNGAFVLGKSSVPATGTEIRPGASVAYTVTAENTTKRTLAGATFVDDLSDVLDDASVDATSVAVTGPGNAQISGSTLTWRGDLAAGEKVTVTYTAKTPTTMPAGSSHTLKNVVTSDTELSTCVAGGSNPECQTSHPVRGLTVTKRMDNKSPASGSTVNYTITAFNDAATNLTTTLTDNLADVLDDAVYAGNVTSSIPGASVDAAAQTLAWSGTIPAGQTLSITYSVVVKGPGDGRGDSVLRNAVVLDDPASNCATGSTDALCRTESDPIPGLYVTKSVADNPDSLVAGEILTYTVDATNTGGTDLTGTTLTDNLTEVLDDAAYLKDAKASLPGDITFAGNKLVWKGDLKRGEKVSLTYSVKISSPATGDHEMRNTVTAPLSNCAVASSAECVTLSPSPALSVTKELVNNPAEVYGNQVLTYRVTAINTGKVDLNAADLHDDLSNVIDDADFAGVEDVAVAPAGLGTVSYDNGMIDWVGPLAQGERVELTYTVTVKVVPENHILDGAVYSTVPGNSCPDGSDSPLCNAETRAVVLPLSVTASAGGAAPADSAAVTAAAANAPGLASTAPGSLVDYTLTITNDAIDTRTGLVLVNDLAGVLDDSVFVADSEATDTGELVVDPDAKTLTWTGDLKRDQVATVTYTVLVGSPSAGDLLLDNRVASASPGSLCPVGTAGLECTAATDVIGVVFDKTSDVPEGEKAQLGQKVVYTVTIVNNSATPTTDVTMTDDMSDVLDDAKSNGGIVITPEVGSAALSGTTLTWTGDLEARATITLTYSVTVNGEVTGDALLGNVISSDAVGSNCVVDSADTRCFTGSEIERPFTLLALTGASATVWLLIAVGVMTLAGLVLTARKRREAQS